MKCDLDILIVDDSEVLQKRLFSLLTTLTSATEKCIVTASDYDSAILELNKKKPHVVLLDINLPGKSGLEILRVIKNTDKKIKVIMLTNSYSDYYKQICGFLGAEFFLDKSNHFETIPELLKEILDNKSKN